MFEEIILHSNIGETILEIIEVLIFFIELLVALFLAYAVFASFFQFIFLKKTEKTPEEKRFQKVRHKLAHSLLLGLEMLIAADIIQTVVLESSSESILMLGLLVLIRTFLSWSLTIEIEGRWPWKGESEKT